MADSMRVRRAVVLGDGGWGTALAILLVRRGIETTLWSYQPAQSDELSQLLKIAGVSDLIVGTASSSEASRSKPDPDIVQAALQRSGAPAEHAIMLGDTPYDVEAALRAGIAIVGVESGGWGAEDLRGAVEVHPGAAGIYGHYDESAFARLIRDGRLTSRTS